jgi:hypothetical protein
MLHPASPPAPLFPVTQSTPWKTTFDGGLQEDDPMWRDYVKEAAAFDIRMVDEWNKTLDVILVFVSGRLLLMGHG